MLIIIENEEADRFIVDKLREIYNCITVIIRSQPENERNKAGRSVQFSCLPKKKREINCSSS